jgi:transcriptional regulator with XRE-family HTH domain
MIDYYKIGNQIAALRRAKGLTGEKFAQLLKVSPQAVSKWENGRCLPETSLLPLIAEILGTSIDALLVPQELVIIQAIFSDGITSHDVTKVLNHNVSANKLYLAVNSKFLGADIESGRVKALIVTYQTPEGIYHAYQLENQYLSIDLSHKDYEYEPPMKIIGAYYGNRSDHRDCMVKIQHYDYFNRKEFRIDHESFPSSPQTDETEYLTLIYINQQGIHMISCAEDETLCYTGDRAELYRKDTSVCILPGIEPLAWEQGMDCTWCGAILRALKYMGEDYTYEQLMGISGACYRIAFTKVWDWSATDALVAFDYSTALFRAIGYEQLWADRISKEDRNEERRRIVADIQNGKPVIAINLRIAPEWGVITGYKENGKILLCRTYFDKEILEEHKEKLKEDGGYLESDFWPFLIVHFGERQPRPDGYETFLASLRTLLKSWQAPCERGYYQGKEAYEHWRNGLLDTSLWDGSNTTADIDRRLGVNDALLLNLLDARRCAAAYIRASASLIPFAIQKEVLEISDKYQDMANKLEDFRARAKQENTDSLHYNEINTGRNSGAEFRRKEAALLKDMEKTEDEIVLLTTALLDRLEE